MDIEMMPHAMYFTSDLDTVTKINHVPYQTIVYNDNSMFMAKLMNNTPIGIFIDNGATPSILPLCTYNRLPTLHMYPRTESNTPIHTGGGLIKSHFWLEILLKLDQQTIQIKALVCDSECPYDLILECTSMAQLSTWLDTDWNSIADIMTKHTTTGKGVAYIKPLDPSLPLRPIEIEFENNHCYFEIHNTSNSTVEFFTWTRNGIF